MNDDQEKAVRERAYLLWMKDGCPDGRSEEYWHRALDQYVRSQAYKQWRQCTTRSDHDNDCVPSDI
jgi:hypothetical protein